MVTNSNQINIHLLKLMTITSLKKISILENQLQLKGPIPHHLILKFSERGLLNQIRSWCLDQYNKIPQGGRTSFQWLLEGQNKLPKRIRPSTNLLDFPITNHPIPQAQKNLIRFPNHIRWGSDHKAQSKYTLGDKSYPSNTCSKTFIPMMRIWKSNQNLLWVKT